MFKNNFEIFKLNTFTFVIEQCLIGDGTTFMTVIIKVEKMVDKIISLKERLGQIKLVISNYQKNDQFLTTSQSSAVEIDDEVIFNIKLIIKVIVFFSDYLEV